MKEDIAKFDKVVDECLFGKQELKLKPFNLQKAREGKPVCTRDGRKARIVCFDRIDARPILALVVSSDGKGEDVFDYFVSGKRIANALESDLDLMMLSEKRSGRAKIRKDMERAIGEIFEYNGEWYQCLIGNRCRECDFSSNNITCDIHGTLICTCKGRSDETSVVFKKLEKVGIPFSCNYYGDARLVMMQEYQLFDVNAICCYSMPSMYITDYKHKRIAIEIKQNKEDMEEKKPTYEELLHYYHSTVGLWAINRSPQEVSLDWICNNAFQLGVDEKDSSSENIGNNLREFNLEAAKQGKPVCTRDGRKARIICFDKGGEQPIVALIKKNEEESIDTFFSNGHSVSKTDEVAGDLMMSLEKKEGWVNLYKSSAYSTKEEAMKYRNKCNDYIDTINITWEE